MRSASSGNCQIVVNMDWWNFMKSISKGIIDISVITRIVSDAPISKIVLGFRTTNIRNVAHIIRKSNNAAIIIIRTSAKCSISSVINSSGISPR